MDLTFLTCGLIYVAASISFLTKLTTMVLIMGPHAKGFYEILFVVMSIAFFIASRLEHVNYWQKREARIRSTRLSHYKGG